MLAAAPMTPDTNRPFSRVRHRDAVEHSSAVSLCASSGDAPTRQLLSMPSYLPQDQPDEDMLQQQALADDQLLLDDAASPSPNSKEDAAAVLAALFKQQHHHQQAGPQVAAIRVSSSPSAAGGSGGPAAAAGTGGSRHPVLVQKFPSFGRTARRMSEGATNGHCSPTAAAAAGPSSMDHSSTIAATTSSNGSSNGTGDPVTPVPQPLKIGSAAAPSPASPVDAAAAAGGGGGGGNAASNGYAHLPDSLAAQGASPMAGFPQQRTPRESSSSSVSAASHKVSLLSQQLADVQRRTAAIEAAGGASGRGQSLFWQHIHSTAPASRSDSHTAVAAVAAAAAAADASRSSQAARSAARHQRQLEEEYQQQYRHQHHHQQQQWQDSAGRLGSPQSTPGRRHQASQQQGTASSQQPNPQQQQRQQQQQPARFSEQSDEQSGAAAVAAGSSFRSAGGRLLQPPPVASPHQPTQQQQQQQQQQQPAPGRGASPERGQARAFSRVSSGNGSLLGQVLSLDPNSWDGQEPHLAAAATAASVGGATPLQQQQRQQQQQQGLNGCLAAAAGAAGPQDVHLPGLHLISGSPGLVSQSLHMLPERFGLLNSPSVKSFLLKHRSQLLPLDSAAAAAAAAGVAPLLSSGQLQPQGSGGVSDPQRRTLYTPEPQPPAPHQPQPPLPAGEAQVQQLHPQLYWAGSPELLEPLLGNAHGSRLTLTPLPLGPQLGVGWEPGLGVTLGSPGGRGVLPRSGSRRGLLAMAGSAPMPAAAAGGVAAPAGLSDFHELMEQLLSELCCCGEVTSEEAGADLAAACSIHHVCFGGPPVVAGRGWWEGRCEQARDAWEQWQGRAARKKAQLWRLLRQLWKRCAAALGSGLQQAPRSSSSHLGSGGGSSSSGHLERGPGVGSIVVGVSPLGRHQAPGYRPWR